jgi:hypothetical protein
MSSLHKIWTVSSFRKRWIAREVRGLHLHTTPHLNLSFLCDYFFLYITANGNAFCSQLSSSFQGSRYMVQQGWRYVPMRAKARGLAQHGGPPGWLEESDPAGVFLYVIVWAVPPAFSIPYRSWLAASWWNFQLLIYSKRTQPSVMSSVTQGRHDLVL